MPFSKNTAGQLAGNNAALAAAIAAALGGETTTPGSSTNNPLTVYGEASTAERTFTVQENFAYDLSSDKFETFTGATGSATASDGLAVLQTGVGVGGYGIVRTKKPVLSRSGQGAGALFDMCFDAPIALSSQRAGFIASENELSFGYFHDGSISTSLEFGIFHRSHQSLDIHTFQVTVQAGGAETATVTLDGVAFTPAITAGTVQHNAREISDASYTGWETYQQDDTVYFIAQDIGVKAGAFSFSSTGAATATVALVKAGLNDPANDTFIIKSLWNIDRMDGSSGEFNPSGQTLDPLNLNPASITYQYGSGGILFKIENAETGIPEPVHLIKYANANTLVSIRIPSMPIAIFAASLGSTGTNLTAKSSEFSGFIEGKNELLGQDYEVETTLAITTSEIPIFSIRVNKTFKGLINQGEVILTRATYANESSSKTLTIRAYLNGTLTGYNFQETNSNSFVSKDTSATAITGGRKLPLGAAVPVAGGFPEDLINLNMVLTRGDIITFTGQRSSGGSTEGTVTLGWKEEI